MKGIQSCSCEGNSLYLLCKPTRHRRVQQSCLLSFTSSVPPHLLHRTSSLHTLTFSPLLFAAFFQLSLFSFPSPALLFAIALRKLRCTACRDSTGRPLTATTATGQQNQCRGGRIEKRKKKGRMKVVVLVFQTLNCVIKWLETDRHNKNRAWRLEEKWRMRSDLFYCPGQNRTSWKDNSLTGGGWGGFSDTASSLLKRSTLEKVRRAFKACLLLVLFTDSTAVSDIYTHTIQGIH